MKIKAIGTIIEWDAEQGRTVIINPGETDDLSDTLAQAHIDSSTAKKAGTTKEAAPAETTAPAKAPAPADAAKDALKAARLRYKELAGKNVNNAWSIDIVNAKIADLEAAKAPAETTAPAGDAGAEEGSGGEGDGSNDETGDDANGEGNGAEGEDGGDDDSAPA